MHSPPLGQYELAEVAAYASAALELKGRRDRCSFPSSIVDQAANLSFEGFRGPAGTRVAEDVTGGSTCHNFMALFLIFLGHQQCCSQPDDDA